jgi:hypothetical protein
MGRCGRAVSPKAVLARRARSEAAVCFVFGRWGAALRAAGGDGAFRICEACWCTNNQVSAEHSARRAKEPIAQRSSHKATRATGTARL